MREVVEEEKRRDEAENRQRSEENLKHFQQPSTYFGYIAGTSTRGLIAIMLGRLKLTVDECIEQYEIIGETIFAHPRRFHVQNKLWLCSKFDWRNVEGALTQVVNKYAPNGLNQNDLGQGPWTKFREQVTDGEHHCKTVAVAVKDNGDAVTTYLFRSYVHPVISGQYYALNPDNIGCEADIVDVARATSAAPGYFKVFEVGDHKFMDGGVQADNPATFAWREVVQMARNNDTNTTAGKAIACFLSIGTGKSKYEIFGRKVQSRAHEAATPYFRFNVKEGLQDVKLDERTEKNRKVRNDNTEKEEKISMSTLAYLQFVTEAYLASKETMVPRAAEVSVMDEVQRCATKLVDYRRARERISLSTTNGNAT
ncbi:FabD/lysophospholipase-like protein [Glarea lozoyensis ATCC 20868]|uniref:FabD/lysophospholipase-like protein n=1 Tax=Glarea lozoyensis (strain ATCC 20868 / MF5171) TaxID=1116229 RepID=S3DBZ1_GLAL2|nr:FabD/lysophospholipase-like protein [Glarea lozoyensis ATCC 20868]EPE34619.1 FabD/lysophospholipase-like protein [Glarea lozoyensis ATCC 20868]